MADFFVHRIPGWRDEIEVLRQYAHCAFYRPAPTLFVLLKMERLSEQDLQDCLAVISKARAEALPFDESRLKSAMLKLHSSDDARLVLRRAELASAIEG